MKEPAVYFARSVSVAEGRLEEYLDLTGTAVLPVWRVMKTEGTIESLDTIRLTRPLHVDEGIPDWHVITVGRVGDGQTAERFFTRETELIYEGSVRTGFEDGLATVMREETLRTTPNSHHPTPRPDLVARRQDVRLSVEMINVTPTPEALAEYQRLMMINAGPASGRLCDEGWLYSFVPLETDRVLRAADGMPPWKSAAHDGDVPRAPRWVRFALRRCAQRGQL